MATRQQIEAAKEAKKRQKVGAAAGLITSVGTASAQNLGVGLGWGAVVDVLAALGTTFYTFLSGRKFSKKLEKKKEIASQSVSYVDQILNTLEVTGLELIDQGLQPGTTEFEKELHRQLYDVIGYKGQCSADVWAPDSEKQKPRPILFYTRDRGSRLIPGPGAKLHPYLQAHWSSKCSNIRDNWVEYYYQKLKEGKRAEKIQNLESSLTKVAWTLRIGFGLIIFVMLAIMATYSFSMEK